MSTGESSIFLTFLIIRITHPRFTELDYSGEGPGDMHLSWVPKWFLLSVTLALETFRAGFQFWFRSMMLYAWQNYLSGHLTHLLPDPSRLCLSLMSRYRLLGITQLVYYTDTSQDRMLLRFHPEWIPPSRGRGPIFCIQILQFCILSLRVLLEGETFVIHRPRGSTFFFNLCKSTL